MGLVVCLFVFGAQAVSYEKTSAINITLDLEVRMSFVAWEYPRGFRASTRSALSFLSVSLSTSSPSDACELRSLLNSLNEAKARCTCLYKALEHDCLHLMISAGRLRSNGCQKRLYSDISLRKCAR